MSAANGRFFDLTFLARGLRPRRRRQLERRERAVNSARVELLEDRTLLTDIVYVNDDFTQMDGTVIADADPNTAGNQPATIGVDAFDTIQEGVDAANVGGMVLVTDDFETDGPGLYAESISITRNLTLKSTEGTRTAVVLDGGNANRVLSIDGAVTVLLESITLQNGNAQADDGGGLSITNGATATLTDLAILDNTAVSGGGLRIDSSGRVRIVHTLIRGNSAAQRGGGVYVENNAGDVQMEYTHLTDNAAGQQGGGLWNHSGSSILMSVRTTIVGNSAVGDGPNDGGGGIYNYGTLVIGDVAIENNAASGAMGRGGGVFNAGGVMTTNESFILGNTAKMAGGGVAVTGGDVTVAQSFINTNAARDGAGLHVGVSGLNVVLHNARMRFNRASRQGGGLWNHAGSVMTVDQGSTLIENTANGEGPDDGGGGIFNAGTLNLGAMTVIANSARGAMSRGGGLLSLGGTVRIENGSFITGNAANSAGGGIAIDGGTLSLADSTVDRNRVGFDNPPSPGDGGGIHVSGVGSRVNLFNTQVQQNIAARQGGGLWNDAGSVMVLSMNSQVTSNTASGDSSEDGGGGIFNNGGRLSLGTGVSIDGNTADGDAGSGGGILSTNGVVTLFESSITNNTANRAGGGIELVTGILEMTGATVDNNSATGGGSGPGNGGGVHITGLMGQVGRINVIGGSVSGNTAANEGGGLWNQAGNIMVVRLGAVVSGNTASGDAADDGGGGIFNNNGRLAIGQAVVISGNTANGTAGSGGGILSMGSGVSIEGGTTISGNAANRAGGGVEVVNGEVIVMDSTIENNNAGVTGTPNPGNGGGIHVTGTHFTRVDLRSSIVRNNQAASEGGGLWNQTNGVMLVRIGTEVSGNIASGDAADQGGGGIFSRGRLVVNAATIDGNQANGAAGSGGGILNVGAVTTIENSTVSNNTAHRAGGGIEVVDGWISTRNMDLTGNNAGGAAPSPGDGGGLHVSGAGLSRVTIEGGQVSGNTAARDGGGIRHQAGSILVVTDGTTISGNTAFGNTVDHGGGGLFNDGGRVALTAASIWGNSAIGTHGSGGGIYSTGGGLTIDNSTLSGNMANGRGGGIRNLGELIAANATIVNNRSDADSSGTGTGGGIVNNGTASLKNSIVAGNDTGPAALANDIAGNDLQSSAHNIIGDASSAGGLIDGVNGNIVGNAGSGVLALATILDPTLADNGGPTLTHALAVGSPAINTGNNTLAKNVGGIPFSTDQRGVSFPRINGGTVDMGAVES